METNNFKKRRKEIFAQIEANLQKTNRPEDRLFARHPDEDHIIVSHALFWVMSKPFIGRLRHINSLVLLHKYEEEMLEAYLTESDEFPELLNFCNNMYEVFPYELSVAIRGTSHLSEINRLQATAIVAAGYGGEMSDEMVAEILDDIDFLNNKVYCRKIEEMLPLLSQLVETEMLDL